MSEHSWWRQFSSNTAGGLTAALAFLLVTTLWPAARAFFLSAITIPAGAWLLAMALMGFLAWRAYLRKPVVIEKVAVELLSPPEAPVPAGAKEEPELSEIQISCLKLLIPHEWVTKVYMANELKIGHQLAQFHIEELLAYSGCVEL